MLNRSFIDETFDPLGCYVHHGATNMIMLMFYYAGPKEISPINQLQITLKDKPVRQANLVHYVDNFLREVRTKFGNSSFPISVTDTTQKEYFLQQSHNNHTYHTFQFNGQHS